MPTCKINLTNKGGGNNRKTASSRTKLFGIIDPQGKKENGSTIENSYNFSSSGIYLAINEKKAKGGNISLKFSILKIKEDGHHFEKVKTGSSLLDFF